MLNNLTHISHISPESSANDMQHMDAAARHLLVEQEQVKGSLLPTFDRVIRIGKELVFKGCP